MTDWQITATTIICAKTDDEVTVIVYKDGSLRCTGENKSISAHKRSGSSCSAAECPQVQNYQLRIFAEENRA